MSTVVSVRQAPQYPANRGIDLLVDRAKRGIAQRGGNVVIVARMSRRSEVEELMLRDMGFGNPATTRSGASPSSISGDDAFTDAHALTKPGLDR